MIYPITPKTDISPLRYKDKCDKYDYLVAVGCGVIAGIVDVFFVGAPNCSSIGGWTDQQVEKCVMIFAKMNGWKGNGKPQSAVGFLESCFRVNYDQRYSADVGGLVNNMTTLNHHMKSLAHSPSLLGLFFSVLNQFTDTSKFVSGGKLITINTQRGEIIGGNFLGKLFCGTVNWIGHLMSDIAGSSGACGRGTGIVMPFYELFNFCTFGDFNPGGARMDLAQLATRAFEQGVDFRFGITQAIPVVLCNVLIRVIWAVRNYFGKKRPLSDCITNDRHDDLRVMLLAGSGVMCTIDGIDAVVRSGGNFLAVFIRINLIGWFRFAYLAIKEICIRSGFALPIQKEIYAMAEYLQELEKIDIEAFKRETELYSKTIYVLENSESEKELNCKLNGIYKELGLKTPWDSYENFDDFMDDENSKLVFE